MNPIAFFSVFGIPVNVIYYAFEKVSMFSYFSKLVNPNIEATMMAFLTTVMYLGEETVARYVGVLINRFCGVTTENLEDLWMLYVAQAGIGLLLALVCLILPTTEQIEKVQKQISDELDTQFKEKLIEQRED